MTGAIFDLRFARPRPDWFDNAACRGLDPDLFFPGQGEGFQPALNVCNACPVRSDCLEWAIETGERGGVWGGVTAKQRDLIRRRRNRRVA